MGKAFAVFSPAMGLSAMLGPMISGGLIGLNLFGTGWRMIFLVNIPIGIAALAAGARYLPAAPARPDRVPARPAGRRAGRRGDVPAGVPAGAGPRAGLARPGCSAMLAASVAVLAGFGWYQVRRKRAGASAADRAGHLRQPRLRSPASRSRSRSSARWAASC